MTLIWEEDVPEEGVAEVHLGEVEGATPVPDVQSTAPDTRPLPDEAPIEHAAESAAEPAQQAAQPEPPAASAAPTDPFHGLPPIRDLDDEEDAFAAAVPKQPSADLPVEPAIAPTAAPAVTASAPAAVASLKPEAEKHDSVWMRHETDPHTLFAPVPRRHHGHARRTQAEPTGPTPQRTLTGAPRPRKVRGPNHGVSAATLDFLRAAQAREQARKTTGRRALARIAIGLLTVLAVAQLLFLARAEIARRAPSTRPMLEVLCQPLHCTIAPPRDLDALQIESSQLQRQEGDASDQYVLTATLRNRAGGPIALPAIELITTDLQDQLLSRRALLPADYLNPSDSAYGKSGLPARAELPIRVRFQSQRPTANYRVLIFYP
ncbi:transmembrane protein [Burkholderiaceae bacterium 26]|nr:transmembrane protein [Burkholderiaceae bacterium 26]